MDGRKVRSIGLDRMGEDVQCDWCCALFCAISCQLYEWPERRMWRVTQSVCVYMIEIEYNRVIGLLVTLWCHYETLVANANDSVAGEHFTTADCADDSLRW